ncbi:amino acid permease [Gottfriedia solisilvae]|uniref:Amino acid permease n=1 Tax=Gottfriedia solisilvae TaxID=1516104 RepID=A0A8J3AG85_9BACI|nr:amino acid permease [Gottfriedia solisilvae]GGI13315.1 amino acid permease [Gottfriedia solisilvae]
MGQSKKLGVLALSFLSINSILGLRNIAFASTIGPSAMFYWIIAAIIYFIPLGLIVAELSTTYPNQGGMGVWVRKAFGEKASFLCSWFFWIANFTYYPSLLLTTTIAIAYGINQPGIANNPMKTAIISSIIFWIVTLLTLKGTKMSGRLASIGAPLGVLVPAILIFGFGIYSMLSGETSATNFTSESIMPNNLSFGTIMFLSTLMFGFSGAEMLGTIAGNVKNPQKTFPRAILITSIIIATVYILATIAFQFVITISSDQTATALYLFADKITNQFGLSFSLSQILGICFVLAFVGSLSFLILNPSVMIAESAKEVLSKNLLKKNKDGMPATLVKGQAIAVTLILLLSAFVPSVSSALNMLILMSTLAFFIPYVFLISAYIKLRMTEKNIERPFKIKNNKVAITVALVGMLSVVGTILLTLIPAPGTTLLEYLPIVLGPVLFGCIGFILYRNGNLAKSKK